MAGRGIRRGNLPRLVLGLALALSLLVVSPAVGAVYWGSNGMIGAANGDGSMPIVAYPYEAANVPDAGLVSGVAVNATHLYWSDPGNRAIGGMTLSNTPDGRVAFGEPANTINQQLVPDVERPWGVAVDSSHVYWASTAGAIGRARLDGGAAERSFIAGLDSPCGIAVDGGYVYWGEYGPESIGRARLDGTDVDPEFIDGVASPCGIAVNASHIYWSDEGSIGRAGIDGSDPDPNFISAAGRSCGVAVDATHVYWTNFMEPGTSVSRANLDGSGAGRIAGHEWYPSTCGVAVDSRVFQPRPPSLSLPVRFGALKRQKKGRLLVLHVYVPERGELTLTSPGKLGWSLDKGPEPPSWRGGSFRWTLKLWPGKGQVGKRIRRQLRNRRRAPVTLHFNWAQQGRAPVAASKQVAFAPQSATPGSGK